MPTFQLNEPDYFIPQAVALNDFLNGKLTTDQYGKWYSVQFEGNAETYLWQTKTAPEPGQKYYGQLELTKSGKATKFKRLKEEDRTSSGASSAKSKEDYEPGTNARWAIGLAYRAFIQVTGSPEGDDGQFPFSQVEQHATKLVHMFDKIKNSGQGGNNENLSSAPSVKEVEKPASGSLKSAWEGRNNLPKAVTASDEYQYTEADIPEYQGE